MAEQHDLKTDLLAGMAELLEKQEHRRDERWARIEQRMDRLAAAVDEMRGQHNRRYDRLNDERDEANQVAATRWTETTMRLGSLEDRATELERKIAQLERRLKALEDEKNEPLIVAQLNALGDNTQ